VWSGLLGGVVNFRYCPPLGTIYAAATSASDASDASGLSTMVCVPGRPRRRPADLREEGEMESDRFDAIIRTLSAGTSRRGVLAVLAGLAGLGGTAAVAKGRGHDKRAPHQHGKAGQGKPGKTKTNQEPPPHTRANAACQAPGHPCEGNQECCNGGDGGTTICVASGPGAAKRCTACADGKFACGNQCIPVCKALDQCHVAGECIPADHVCTNPAKPDGAGCDDGDACTQTDTCQQGVCVGGNPVVCTAQDQCHVAGVCNSRTGECSNPAKADGAACEDGNLCTQGDTCQSGACRPGPTVNCPATDCRLAGRCDAQTGTCVHSNAPDGTPCNNSAGCPPSPVAQQGCGKAEECFSGTCEVCSGVGAPCDGSVCPGCGHWGTRCCPENGSCQHWGRDGSLRCCHPDGTQCRSEQSLAQEACCGGYCNTETGQCSSHCTESGHRCRNHDECCSGNCRGLSPTADGLCE
jgi:hypothetical protein